MSEEILNTTNGIPISYVYWGDILIWPDGTPPAPVIYYSFSVSPTSITMTDSAQTVTVNVQTNSPSWQVLSYPSWMNLESSAQVGGSWVLTFSVDENEGAIRTDNIVFQYQSDNVGTVSTAQMPMTQNMREQ